MGNATVQRRVFVGVAAWPVLVHYIHVRIWRNVFRYKSHDLSRPGYTFRHDEMAQKDSSQCNSVFVNGEITDLTMHFLYGVSGFFRIIRGLQILACNLRVPKI